MTEHYSQHGEEAAIVAWADGRVGTFLDFGCHDGVSYSNTARLAELGWSGLCVDAAPDMVAECALRYAANPRVDVLCAAFDTDTFGGVATVHWTPGRMNSALTDRLGVGPTIPVLVPRLSLLWLAPRLKEAARPLFASIDLEGGSIDALRWLVTAVGPDCVCVEANNPRDRLDAAQACNTGYQRIFENDWNVIYAKGGAT